MYTTSGCLRLRNTPGGYCSSVNQDEDWARHVAVDTGRRIAAARSRQGLSAQQLADRCAALGLPALSRIVIARLENGRRDSVSTAEVLVLAAALEVPPADLMFPLGERERAEVLPGFTAPVEAAGRWLTGELILTVEDGSPAGFRWPAPGEESTLTLLKMHSALVRHWTGNELAEQSKAAIPDSLRLARAELRRRGMILPPLPAALASALREDPED